MNLKLNLISNRKFLDDEHYILKIKLILISLLKVLKRNFKLKLLTVFLLGLAFFALPLLYFYINFHNTFEYFDWKSQLKFKSNILWIVISLFFLTICTFILLIYKLIDMILFPSLKYWNYFSLARAFQFFIFFSLCFYCSIILYMNLSDLQDFLNEMIKDINKSFISGTIKLISTLSRPDLKQNLIKKINQNISPFKYYIICHMIKLLLIKSKKSIFYLGINASFLSILFTLPYQTDENLFSYLDHFFIILFSMMMFYFCIILTRIISLSKRGKMLFIFEFLNLTGCCILIYMSIFYIMNDKISNLFLIV